MVCHISSHHITSSHLSCRCCNCGVNPVITSVRCSVHMVDFPNSNCSPSAPTAAPPSAYDPVPVPARPPPPDSREERLYEVLTPPDDLPLPFPPPLLLPPTRALSMEVTSPFRRSIASINSSFSCKTWWVSGLGVGEGGKGKS